MLLLKPCIFSFSCFYCLQQRFQLKPLKEKNQLPKVLLGKRAPGKSAADKSEASKSAGDKAEKQKERERKKKEREQQRNVLSEQNTLFLARMTDAEQAIEVDESNTFDSSLVLDCMEMMPTHLQ